MSVLPGPHQLSQSFTPPAVVDVIVGETVHTQIELYGFPEPTTLFLQRMADDLISPPCCKLHREISFVWTGQGDLF